METEVRNKEALELIAHITIKGYNNSRHNDDMQECVPRLEFDDEVKLVNETKVEQTRPTELIQFLARHYLVSYNQKKWLLSLKVNYSYDGEIFLKEYMNAYLISSNDSKAVILKYPFSSLKQQTFV